MSTWHRGNSVRANRRISSARNDLPAVEQAARPAMPAVPPAGLRAWRAGLRAPLFWLRLCSTAGQAVNLRPVGSRRGSALLAVLWLVAALSAIAFSVGG